MAPSGCCRDCCQECIECACRSISRWYHLDSFVNGQKITLQDNTTQLIALSAYGHLSLEIPYKRRNVMELLQVISFIHYSLLCQCHFLFIDMFHFQEEVSNEQSWIHPVEAPGNMAVFSMSAQILIEVFVERTVVSGQ